MKQDEFNQQLCSFLKASTTPFHAVAEMAKRLLTAGYTPLAEDATWNIEAGGRYFLTRNGSSIVAFGAGQDFGHVASNIVFMENDKDPWHVGTRTVPVRGGRDGSVTRTVAKGGAHHQDLRFSSHLDALDVQRARAFERAQLRRWLSQ